MAVHISNQEKANYLSECVEYYEICNRAEGKSAKTISWYSANLRHFRSYLKSRHLPDSIDSIDIKILREYVLYLLKRNKFDDHPYTPVKMEPLSVTTIHGHVRTLRAFFTWLVIEGLTQNNVAKDLKPPKISKKVVTTLSDQEIESILNTLSPAEPIREIYKSAVDGRLTVIDKENGGKADSLNAGINYSRSRLFCAIDADDSYLTASEQSV